METALLLLGLSFFLVCTLLYLRQAFHATLGWGAAGIVLPPSAVLFYSINWNRLRPLALLHLASLLLVLFATVLWVRANPYSFDGSRLVWLRDWLAPAYSLRPLEVQPVQFATEDKLQPYLKRLRGHAGGYIQGDRLNFVRATFINGILRFKTDTTLFSSTEIAIPLQDVELKPGENSLDYSPESADSPKIYISDYPVDEGSPKVTVYDHGYWMDLVLSSVDKNYFSGYIKLRLPDGRKSFLAGEFKAFTRDLRYDGNDVDPTFNSNATIEYVAEQYIINKLGNSLDQVTGFDGTFFQTALDDPTARTEARFRMADGSTHSVKMNLIKVNDGWVVSSGPSTELMAALRTIESEPTASIQPIQTVEMVREVSLDVIDTLVGKNVVILTRDGKQRQGKVSEVDQFNVTLVTPMEGGSMSMLVKRREITDVKLSQ